MSDSERITPLLSLPFNSFLMLRLEYALLTGNDLQAMLLRIIEKRMEDQRRRLYQQRMNSMRDVPQEVVLDIPKEVWVPISHAAFLYDLYGLVLSENTLKKALHELRKRKLIFTRKGQGRYAPDEYQLNLKLLNEEFKRMQQQGKAGYQPLTPSEVDTLMASSGYQPLTPSEGQRLIPCKTVRGSKVDPLRGSESDPSNREITEERFREEVVEEGGTSGSEVSEVVVSTAAAPRFSEGESLVSGQDEPASGQAPYPTVSEQEQTDLIGASSDNQQGSSPALTGASGSSQTASSVAPASTSPSSPLEQPGTSPASTAAKAKDETLLPEALVALVEHLLGEPYDAQARACQMEAARTLLAMNLVTDLSTLERVYAACYDDWWRQHYGKMHLTHLLEREKSGQLRIVRLLARLTPAPTPPAVSVSSSVFPLRPEGSCSGSKGKERDGACAPDPFVKRREREALEKLLLNGEQLLANIRACSPQEAERFAAALQLLRQQQGGMVCNA